ncbi:DUF2487 family protein [Virgibacillus ndiopensis]|uniref:DUF2487 family protein n=1 Tax=Virgibacillus ndiopensis TaxID=2004408 RepID=UPI000C085C6F|nr:DUF2487 family protein [Virgibacillus ndiopensis]
MQWIKEDLQQYIQAKEYVDTIIVPLIPYHLSQDSELEKNAFQSEVLSIFAKEIEKELSGRVMLTPNYHYLKSGSKEEELKRINSWAGDALSQPFKNVFFVTFDSTWKKNEQALDGTLIWLPGIQSGDLKSNEMRSFIHDQVEQIGEFIKSYW